MVSGPHWRKTHAAVAHNHGADAMVTRWRHAIRPGGLAVVVGVNIHKARRDQCTVGADFLCTTTRHLAYFGNLAVLNRHIGGKGGLAGAIDHRTRPNHQIVL